MRFDINRRKIFDTSAIYYDKYRPSYPNRLVEDIISLSSLSTKSNILEVGSGTGKATILFAKYNLNIDCIELGENLVEIARKKCEYLPKVKINVGKFEDFDFEPRCYDLLFSAQAYHWINPSQRMELASKALRKDGSLALFYNFSQKPVDKTMIELSEQIAIESDGILKGTWDYEKDIDRWRREILSSCYFSNIAIKSYPWKKKYSAEEYIGLFYTFSDFLVLSDNVKTKIANKMRQLLEKNGGFVEKFYNCVLIHAKRK